MNRMVYIFGQPGSGKTTLVRELCKGSSLLYESDEPIKHRCYSGRRQMFSVLGADSIPFGGTDTLSYTAVSGADNWLKKLARCPAGNLVVAEGDRLANVRFFSIASQHYDLRLVYLNCDDSEAQRRRNSRASEHGIRTQSLSWVSGRRTKSINLLSRFPKTVRLWAGDELEHLVSSLRCLMYEQNNTREEQ